MIGMTRVGVSCVMMETRTPVPLDGHASERVRMSRAWCGAPPPDS